MYHKHLRFKAQFLGRVVLAHVFESGIAPNYLTRLVLGLVHHLAVIVYASPFGKPVVGKG